MLNALDRLVVSSTYNILQDNIPLPTFWGIVVSPFQSVMLPVTAKLFVGKQLNSEAILVDAECTMVVYSR